MLEKKKKKSESSLCTLPTTPEKTPRNVAGVCSSNGSGLCLVPQKSYRFSFPPFFLKVTPLLDYSSFVSLRLFALHTGRMRSMARNSEQNEGTLLSKRESEMKGKASSSAERGPSRSETLRVDCPGGFIGCQGEVLTNGPRELLRRESLD